MISIYLKSKNALNLESDTLVATQHLCTVAKQYKSKLGF